MSILESQGISQNSASKFLSELAPAIQQVLNNTSLEKTVVILLSDKPSQILNFIDTDVLAAKLNLSSSQVASALKIIAPAISQVFALKSSELVTATAASAWKSEDENLGICP